MTQRNQVLTSLYTSDFSCRRGSISDVNCHAGRNADVMSRIWACPFEVSHTCIQCIRWTSFFSFAVFVMCKDRWWLLQGCKKQTHLQLGWSTRCVATWHQHQPTAAEGWPSAQPPPKPQKVVPSTHNPPWVQPNDRFLHQVIVASSRETNPLQYDVLLVSSWSTGGMSGGRDVVGVPCPSNIHCWHLNPKALRSFAFVKRSIWEEDLSNEALKSSSEITWSLHNPYDRICLNYSNSHEILFKHMAPGWRRSSTGPH